MAPLLNLHDESSTQGLNGSSEDNTIGITTNGITTNGIVKKKPAWRFDTLQVHSGLEKRPAYGQCTLPIYNTASFKFNSDDSAIFGFNDIAKRETFIYSRLANVSDGRRKHSDDID